MSQATHKATLFLERHIELYRQQSLLQLPDLLCLAQLAGVAHQTMRKALALFEQQGSIRIVRRKGIFLIPVSSGSVLVDDQIEVATGKIESAQTLADRIAAKIGAGGYKRGSPLPGYKALCATYGTGYPSVRLALQHLARSAIIERFGRGYRPCVKVPHSSYGKIVFVAVTDSMQVLINATPWASDFWRLLDARLSQSGIAMEVYGYLKAVGEYPWHDGRKEDMVRRDRDKPVLGYFLWTLGMNAETAVRLINLIASTNRPLAVMHDNPGITLGTLSREIRKHPLARLWTFAISSLCGKITGRYLAELGHERVAFFSRDGVERLWQSRLDGLMAGYRELQRPFAGERFFPNSPLETPSSKELPAGQKALRAAQLAIRQEFKLWRGNYDETLREPDFIGHLSPFLDNQRMASSFERALAQGQHSAWVGATDREAVLALSYLRRQGVAVPGEISVVGFDDSTEAIGYGVSSYNFNIPSLVDAMADFLYDPKPAAGPSRIIEIPGKVMHRSSCGTIAGGN